MRRANRVFAELVQTPVTAIPGRPWLALLPPGWADPVGRAVMERTPSTVELRAGDRPLMLSTIPLADRSAVLVFEDQTDKRRLQDQLIQSEKMSAIGQLIAGVAHDLNNPLASVVGFSDFLMDARRGSPRARRAAAGDPPGGRARRHDRQEPAVVRAQPGGRAEGPADRTDPRVHAGPAAQPAHGPQGRGDARDRARPARAGSERESDQAGVREHHQQRRAGDRQRPSAAAGSGSPPNAGSTAWPSPSPTTAPASRRRSRSTCSSRSSPPSKKAKARASASRSVRAS